jgi:tetratricopeptide (TPR) repeat protein
MQWLFLVIGCMAPSPAAAVQQGAAPDAAVERARPLMSQGEQLFASALFEDAARCFEAAARETPNDPAAWNMLGLSLHAQTAWARALPAFERARAILPRETRILDNIGACQFELHDYERSVATFRAAVAIDAQDSRAHMFLGRIAYASGDDAQAERELGLAVAAPAPDPVALLHQGLFLFQSRRLDEAQKSFERALALDPDLSGAHLNLGLVLQRKGETEAARVHLARFRELTEIVVGEEHMRMRVTAHLRDANTEIEAGRLDAALWSALHARDEAPDLPIVHQLLARIHALAGRKEESEKELALARELIEKARAK